MIQTAIAISIFSFTTMKTIVMKPVEIREKQVAHAMIFKTKPAEIEAPQAEPTEEPKNPNPLKLAFSGYSSIEEARALRVNIEQGGDYNAFCGANFSYIGGYGFANSTWRMLCAETGTSVDDFSQEHQDLLADQLVKDYFGGDWGNVPRSGGW